MPSWKSRHFKIHAQIGTIDAVTVQLAQGTSDQHQVVITPLSGLPKPTKLRCALLGGTAANYDPPPRDRWNHDFGSIDRSTAANLRTATRIVEAGNSSGTVTLRVNEVEVDDGLPQPNIHTLHYDITVTIP